MLDELFWRKYFKVYDALNLFLPYQQMLNAIAEELDIKTGELALDAGCGSGNLAVKLRQRGATVIGADFCKAALDICKAKDPSIRVQLIDLTRELPFSNEYFDKIACNNVIYTISREGQLNTLHELYRVLKKGGCFAMVNPMKGWSPKEIYLEGFKAHIKQDGLLKAFSIFGRMIIPTARIFFYNSRINKEDQYYFFDLDEQEKLLRQIGFKEVSKTKLVYGNQGLLTKAKK
ncbi:putative Methyltransferase type 11 [uncultured Desulfobacterium sp.]|uniref:Putative Methyltransferase type 11 n=1 Tax=uncultured Desulfobacterium sp. TaxID=201089 RepID=A0A445N498_9BACT|nr:putative Methyltransferase type 11 [uncultured Desulfobacterium sp.]